MERTLKNGKRYRFEEIWSGFIKTYCLFNDKWNPLTVSFRNWDEVNAWCGKMDYDYEHPKFTAVNFTSCPPDNEYSDFTKYYGD